MKYGSPESLEFCDKIAKVIVDNALKASALLAKDFGAYPKYKADKVLKSDFFWKMQV